jgi:hypothetical protein
LNSRTASTPTQLIVVSREVETSLEKQPQVPRMTNH